MELHAEKARGIRREAYERLSENLDKFRKNNPDTDFRYYNAEYYVDYAFDKIKFTAEMGFYGITLSVVRAPDGFWCCPNRCILKVIKERLEKCGYIIATYDRDPLPEMREKYWSKGANDTGINYNTLVVTWDHM